MSNHACHHLAISLLELPQSSTGNLLKDLLKLGFQILGNPKIMVYGMRTGSTGRSDSIAQQAIKDTMDDVTDLQPFVAVNREICFQNFDKRRFSRKQDFHF